MFGIKKLNERIDSLEKEIDNLRRELRWVTVPPKFKIGEYVNIKSEAQWRLNREPEFRCFRIADVKQGRLSTDYLYDIYVDYESFSNFTRILDGVPESDLVVIK